MLTVASQVRLLCFVVMRNFDLMCCVLTIIQCHSRRFWVARTGLDRMYTDIKVYVETHLNAYVALSAGMDG